MSQTANSLLTSAGGLLAGLALAGLWALRLWSLLTRARIRLRKLERAAVVTAQLVETLQAERDKYHRQATEDDLTGLPNRRAAIERLTRAVKAHREVGVIVLDLVGFKLINDRFGHRVGNILLSQVAERLRRLERSDIFVARLSGDEFVLIVQGGSPERTRLAAGRAWRHINQDPFVLDARQVDIVASIGYTTTSQAGCDPATLLHLADIAMYWAKANRGIVHGYDENMGDIPGDPRPRDWPPPYLG